MTVALFRACITLATHHGWAGCTSTQARQNCTANGRPARSPWLGDQRPCNRHNTKGIHYLATLAAIAAAAEFSSVPEAFVALITAQGATIVYPTRAVCIHSLVVYTRICRLQCPTRSCFVYNENLDSLYCIRPTTVARLWSLKFAWTTIVLVISLYQLVAMVNKKPLAINDDYRKLYLIKMREMGSSHSNSKNYDGL